MELQDLPLESPREGEVLVRLEASGVNFIDLYKHRGLYRMPLPFTAGEEGAGIIEEVGPGVQGFAPGDRVAFLEQGTYATHIRVSAQKLIRIPPGLESRVAAAVMLQGLTAHYLVHSTYPLKAGETCLIHAAAGGVGLLLLQLARQRGARVLATAGSEAKRALAREFGAHEVFPYEGFAQRVRELTQGQGVQVVYDGVGQATFEGSLDSLAIRGYLVLFGQSSGPVAPLDPQILNQKGGLFLTRPSLVHYTRTREELEWRASDILGAVASGTLRVRIGAELPLEEAPEAQRRLANRETTGKVLLIP